MSRLPWDCCNEPVNTCSQLDFSRYFATAAAATAAERVCVLIPYMHCVLGFGCNGLALLEFYVSLIVCYLPSWSWFISTFPAHSQICLEQPWLLV